jgi:hypothetical protein
MMAPFSQTRGGSFAEAAANVVFGFVVAVAIQRLVYPLFDIATTFGENGLIAFLFTAASFGRSYLMRRLFVYLDRRQELECQERARSLAQRLMTGRL